MWDIKSFSTVPQCSRAKTEKARGGELGKKDGKIKRQSGRKCKSGKGRREGVVDEKSKRRGREEVKSHYFELMRYLSEGRNEGH